MSEPMTPGTSTDPAGSPQTPPAPPPAPSAAPDVPPTVPTIPPPSSQIDGDVARRFDTERGKWQQFASQFAEWQGRTEQREQALRSALDDRLKRIATLEGQITQLQQQLGELPALQEQASQAATYRQQAERLTTLSAYPEIMSQVQEVEVQAEDGTTQKVRQNPIRDTLMASTMTGEQWMQNVLGVVATLTRSVPPAAPPGPPPTTGMTPSPAPSSDSEALWDEYNRLQTEGNWTAAQDVLLRMAEAREKNK